MTPDLLLIHYMEIGLKGRNRPRFERCLAANLKRSLGDSADRVRMLPGRMLIEEPKPDALERATRVFGVANIQPVVATTADLDTIVRRSVEVAEDADSSQPFATFAVRARRARTSFAQSSQIVNERVGDAIRTMLDKRVDLSHPELTVRIEIVGNRAYLSAAKVRGPGGLPVGSAGRVISLLSAGIDSPVATWRMMKRGADPIAVHFHGQPFTDASSDRKAARLVDALGPWGYRLDWWSVPMGEAQREITVSADSTLRVLLYRRLMLRVAERVAERVGALAIVTGESLGQVASQTLENLGAVEAVGRLPVLRPLVGFDKVEIIEEAQRIGTYELSIEEHQDCCTLFVPRDPATHASAEQLDAAEQTYDVNAMVDDCLSRAETRRPTGDAATSSRRQSSR